MLNNITFHDLHLFHNPESYIDLRKVNAYFFDRSEDAKC